MENNEKKKNIEQFVLRHYQVGKLDTQAAMKKVKERLSSTAQKPASPARVASLWPSMRHWVAAVALVLVMVGAWAFMANIRSTEAPSPAAPSPQLSTPNAQLPPTFHFDNTPINDVLSQLSGYYHVELTASDTTRHLSGDFEADDLDLLIGMIEETLHIKIEVVN